MNNEDDDDYTGEALHSTGNTRFVLVSRSPLFRLPLIETDALVLSSSLPSLSPDPLPFDTHTRTTPSTSLLRQRISLPLPVQPSSSIHPTRPAFLSRFLSLFPLYTYDLSLQLSLASYVPLHFVSLSRSCCRISFRFASSSLPVPPSPPSPRPNLPSLDTSAFPLTLPYSTF